MADVRRSSRIGLPEFDLSTVEMVLVLLLASLLVWKGILPGWRSLNTDFPNYYVVARLIREHYCLDRIYDWIWLQRAADHFGVSHQTVGFLGLTPFSALQVVPLSWLPVLEAKRVWIVCNAGLLAASISLLSRATRLPLRRSWLIGLCAVIPLRTDFVLGQMHLVILALLAAAYMSHMRERQLLCGLCIALAAALKVYPVFFCIYFIAKRRWKALGVTLAAAAFCVLLSYLIAGTAAMNAYLSQQLPRTLQGESLNPFLASAGSFSALFHRLFLFEPELNPQPLLPSPVGYAVLYSLAQALLTGLVLSRLRWGFRADQRETLEWSLFTVLLLFLSSAPATYHFVVLIAAGIPGMAVFLREKRFAKASIFLVLYSAACNLRTLNVAAAHVTLVAPLLYLRLWSGIAFLVFLFIALAPDTTDEAARGTRWCVSTPVKLMAAVLPLWAVGFYSAQRHLKDICADCNNRVAIADSAYMRSRPEYASGSLYYVGMQADGYRVLHRNSALPVVRALNDSLEDELSYAVAASGKSIWVEIAGSSSSRLTRLSNGGVLLAACQIKDAEDPAISTDGSILAFLREDHGRGSLWFANPADCDGGGAITPQRITPEAYDVNTIGAGLLGSFVFSGVYEGRESIFSIAPGSSPRLIADGGAALDSPSFSPNGRTLIVRKLIRARWQLVSLDLTSKRERQLTFADCNAYAPSWKDDHEVVYATDCERGLGLSTLALMQVSP